VSSSPDDKNIYVDANTRIQILDTMLLLPHADKEQCAAFIVGAFFSSHLQCFFKSEYSATNVCWSSGPSPSTLSSRHAKTLKTVSSSSSGARALPAPPLPIPAPSPAPSSRTLPCPHGPRAPTTPRSPYPSTAPPPLASTRQTKTTRSCAPRPRSGGTGTVGRSV
jgi:hypothetical protein